MATLNKMKNENASILLADGRTSIGMSEINGLNGLKCRDLRGTIGEMMKCLVSVLFDLLK